MAQMTWSMVSKAAEMSRPTSAVILAAAAYVYTVLMTWSNAVSVEYPRRYTDVRSSEMRADVAAACLALAVRS